MNAEITRLNNKVNKLKQYKQIVNKITGNEYDAYIPEQIQQQPQPQPMQQQQPMQQPQYQQPMRNDSLFMF